MCKNVTFIVTLLALMALAPSAQAVPAPECDTVITGDTITLEGPEPVQLGYVAEEVVYYYLWTAVDEAGNSVTSGTDRIFEFVAPEVTNVDVSLKVTDGYGCINEVNTCFTVTALPACGITGPDVVCEDSPVKDYIYTGEDTSTAEFEFLWSVNNHDVGADENITIDWSELNFAGFGDHVLTLVVDKTYPAGTATSTCEMMVKYIESPVATIGVSISNGGE